MHASAGIPDKGVVLPQICVICEKKDKYSMGKPDHLAKAETEDGGKPGSRLYISSKYVFNACVYVKSARTKQQQHCLSNIKQMNQRHILR